MRLDYTVWTNKTVAECVVALTTLLKERGFGILGVLDFQEILKQKGIELGREYKLLEVCSPQAAKNAMDSDIRVGLLLPCTIAVYTDDKATRISLLKPSSLLQLLPDAHLEEFGIGVEVILKNVVDTCKTL